MSYMPNLNDSDNEDDFPSSSDYEVMRKFYNHASQNDWIRLISPFCPPNADDIVRECLRAEKPTGFTQLLLTLGVSPDAVPDTETARKAIEKSAWGIINSKAAKGENQPLLIRDFITKYGLISSEERDALSYRTPRSMHTAHTCLLCDSLVKMQYDIKQLGKDVNIGFLLKETYSIVLHKASYYALIDEKKNARKIEPEPEKNVTPAIEEVQKMLTYARENTPSENPKPQVKTIPEPGPSTQLESPQLSTGMDLDEESPYQVLPEPVFKAREARKRKSDPPVAPAATQQPPRDDNAVSVPTQPKRSRGLEDFRASFDHWNPWNQQNYTYRQEPLPDETDAIADYLNRVF
jgi:hypothetical protein